MQKNQESNSINPLWYLGIVFMVSSVVIWGVVSNYLKFNTDFEFSKYTDLYIFMGGVGVLFLGLIIVIVIQLIKCQKEKKALREEYENQHKF